MWLEQQGRQGEKPKSPARAYRNLKSILESQELRLGSYKEIVRVVIPFVSELNRSTRKFVKKKNVSTEISSAPVCCLSDIPVQHLGYHAARYGKFAIGFHRAAVVQHGFNPVFYSLHNSSVLRSICNGFWNVKNADTSIIRDTASDIEDVEPDDEDVRNKLSMTASVLDLLVEDLDNTLESARESLGEFIAFVKTFEDHEFATVYCEREWRSVSAFAFRWQDLAMIVLPSGQGKNKYYEEFTRDFLSELDLPRAIPVVPWENLVEH